MKIKYFILLNLILISQLFAHDSQAALQVGDKGYLSYRISNYDEEKVFFTRNKQEYVMERAQFALKKFKIRQVVKIHPQGLKQWAKPVRSN
jgi:uncharacterized protein (DUF1684 family)